MKVEDRIRAFCRLGIRLQSISESEIRIISNEVILENPWFTSQNIILALKGITQLLIPSKLTTWLDQYFPIPAKNKNIGVVMAGNIPMVGFHDSMCVLLCGFNLFAKLSHQDTIMMTLIFNKLIEIEPNFRSYISIKEKLENIQCLLGTGSDNTARYLEYSYRDIPKIIRKNRTSVAIIRGDESAEELQSLGFDVFSYFGLGCRSISMLYIPKGYDLKTIIKIWQKFNFVLRHPKYENNYRYQIAVHKISKLPIIDGDFFLLSENKNIGTPLSVIHYYEYDNFNTLKLEIELNKEKIQIISSTKCWYENSIEFGKSQQPNIDEYADKVDTMEYLVNL